ncbi:MAG: AraC family transcriptional regulator [Alphaproteobacteria bacterium]|nr:AraC family transcriptional regulator [Alphaproteobacteria bacterium]
MNAIGKALWYIEAHFAGPVTLDDVAQVSGLSRFHLSRTFAQITGRSMTAWVRGRRLTEAAKALASGAPDILAVALEAGYGSHEAFSRAFRDHFGLTPEEVRARRSLETLDLVEPIRMTTTTLPKLAPPEIRSSGAMLIAGIRQFLRYEDRGTIPAIWRQLGAHLGNTPNEIEGAAYGLCMAPANGDEGGFDYAAGVAVTSLDDLPEGLTGLRLPPRRYACFRHEGHVSALGSTCAAIPDAWPEGLEQPRGQMQMIEVYGKTFNPHTGFGDMEVWIPLEG